MARRVLFVDDDDDLREILVELLTMFNVECDAVAGVSELEELAVRTGLSYDLAILDINLGSDRPDGIAAYHWLREHGFDGRVAFLTGHARSHPLVKRACHLGDAVVRDKPMSIDELKVMLAQ